MTCSTKVPYLYQFYKTVVFVSVLTLYRPCAYPSAVLRQARRVPEVRTHSSLIKTSISGSSKSPCSRKQTKPWLSKIQPIYLYTVADPGFESRWGGGGGGAWNSKTPKLVIAMRSRRGPALAPSRGSGGMLPPGNFENWDAQICIFHYFGV